MFVEATQQDPEVFLDLDNYLGINPLLCRVYVVECNHLLRKALTMDASNLYYGDETLDDCTREEYDAWINRPEIWDDNWDKKEAD